MHPVKVMENIKKTINQTWFNAFFFTMGLPKWNELFCTGLFPAAFGEVIHFIFPPELQPISPGGAKTRSEVMNPERRPKAL